MKYLIQFDFSPPDRGPRSIVWAGMHQGAPGFAPQKETAIEFDTEAEAKTFMVNAYGKATAECGMVVTTDSPSAPG